MQDATDHSSEVATTLADLGLEPAQVGVVVVDHGSRRAESNLMLLAVVNLFRESSQYGIVESAHMELAEPSIATAVAACVEQGARLVVIHPYFLLPGRHWSQDIPALAAEAAAAHPGLRYLVTAPLGLHPLMTKIMQERIQHCLAQSLGEATACEVCAETGGCQIRNYDA